MKKNYETPSVEKIKFNYRDQVVAASGVEKVTCELEWVGETAIPQMVGGNCNIMQYNDQA